MMIPVDDAALPAAAQIHAEAWRQSHADFCSEAFVALHTAERQAEYLRGELRGGKRLYMLVRQTPVGIVSVKDDLIENLYVLPSEQRKGYGTELLLFAMRQCAGTPRLWILERNRKAYALYAKHGFRPTGARHVLSPDLAEIELACAASQAERHEDERL